MAPVPEVNALFGLYRLVRGDLKTFIRDEDGRFILSKIDLNGCTERRKKKMGSGKTHELSRYALAPRWRPDKGTLGGSDVDL